LTLNRAVMKALKRLSRLLASMNAKVITACGLGLACLAGTLPDSMCTYVDQTDGDGKLDTCLHRPHESCLGLPSGYCLAIVNPGFNDYCWVCTISSGCSCDYWGQVAITYFGGIGDGSTGCVWGSLFEECYCLYGGQALNGFLYLCAT
jgi:hypothetical protein